MNDTLIVASLLIIIARIAVVTALYLAVALWVARFLSELWYPQRKATK